MNYGGVALRLRFTSIEELTPSSLHQGMDRALIHSIAFSRAGSSQYLACSSDKGTAHVFALTASRKKADEEQPRDDGSMNNKTSSFSILRKILPGVPKYVESEWR